VPDEATLDVALMFVPSESVYYELLQTSDNKGQPLDAYCRDKHVLAVSPNTLYAHLCVIAMGLRGMQMEENAKRLLESLSGMEKQMEKFADKFSTLGTHLKNAQQSYSESDKLFERAQNTLETMLGAVSPSSLSRIPRARSRFPAKPAPRKAPDLRFRVSPPGFVPRPVFQQLLQQLFLDFSWGRDILNFVGNYVRSMR